MPIPDQPFPRLNDAKDFDAHFRNLAKRGLVRWGIVGAAGVLTVTIALLLFDVYICNLEIVQAHYKSLTGAGFCLFLLLPALWPSL